MVKVYFCFPKTVVLSSRSPIIGCSWATSSGIYHRYQ